MRRKIIITHILHSSVTRIDIITSYATELYNNPLGGKKDGSKNQRKKIDE